MKDKPQNNLDTPVLFKGGGEAKLTEEQVERFLPEPSSTPEPALDTLFKNHFVDSAS